MIAFQSQFAAVLLLAAASAAALAVAFVTQYGFGYPPCELCVWQRWPYAAAILIGLGAWMLRERPAVTRLALAAITLALAANAGVAGFHVGVEQGWWQGLAGCGATGGADSLDDLRAQIMSAPVVRCTDVSVSVAGLSMAAWNGLFAAGLALLGLRAILKATSTGGAFR